MKTANFLLFLIACVSTGKTTNRLGITGGFPQTAAVAYQYTPFDYTTVEVFAGTLVLCGSAGGRLILSCTDEGFSPRVFAGISVVDAWYGDNSESPMGTASYLWTGVGLGWNFPGGFAIFGDLGRLSGGDPDKGFGYDNSMAISGGLFFSI